MKTTKAKFGISTNYAFRTCKMTEPMSGRKPVSSLLKRSLWPIILVLPAFEAQGAAVLTTLYSFTGANDGAYPYAGLIQSSDGNFYGTTEYGGTNGYGTVFKISPTGALTTLYDFGTDTDTSGFPLNGASPQAALVQGRDGDLYGTTSGISPIGEIQGYGTVFKISTNGELTTLHSFTDDNDGAVPYGGLVQASDGSFYGTTEAGGKLGAYGYGTVFKISATVEFAPLHSFTPGGGGVEPYAGLVQGSDGNLYGTTSWSGPNGYGTVFKISTNGEGFATLYSFTGGTDGGCPYGGLVQASDGNLYGTTGILIGTLGTYGILSPGTVFKLSTNGTLTTLCGILGISDGENPAAALVQGSDGNFYGTTEFDYVEFFATSEETSYTEFCGGGTVFQISTNGALTTLYSFASVTNAVCGALDGANPRAGLAQGIDGNFYGTTSQGGASGAGTVFRLTIVPEFQSVTLTNNLLNLTWSTERGGKYQLQCNSDLSSSNWMNLGNTVVATGATLNISDSITNGPQRYYRLVLSP